MMNYEGHQLYRWRFPLSDEILFTFAFCLEKVNSTPCLRVNMYYEGLAHCKIQSVWFDAFDFLRFMSDNWPHCGLYIHNLTEAPLGFRKREVGLDTGLFYYQNCSGVHNSFSENMTHINNFDMHNSRLEIVQKRNLKRKSPTDSSDLVDITDN